MVLNNKLLLIVCLLLGLAVSFISVKTNILLFLLGITFIVLVLLKKEVLVIGLLLSVDNIYYLVSSEIGEKISVFLILASLILMCFYFIKNNLSKVTISSMNFKYPILGYLSLILLEIINSYYLYGQPIFLGIKASKWYIVLFIYFFMSYLLISNLITKKKVENIVLYLGFIASVIYITQFFLYDKIQFLNVNFLERFEEVRFYQGINLVILSLFLCIHRILKSKETSIVMIIVFVLNLFYVVTVANSRTITIPVLISLIIILVIQNKFKKYTLFFWGAILILCFFTISKENMLIQLVNLLVEDISNRGGTFGFRIREINFYLLEAFKSPLIGRGILFETHYPSYLALGKHMDYFLSDVGIIGFFFKFGFLGLFIIINILILIIKKIFLLWKKQVYRYDFIGYVIYILGAIWLVPIFDNTSSLICLVFLLALIDYEIHLIKLRRTI